MLFGTASLYELVGYAMVALFVCLFFLVILGLAQLLISIRINKFILPNFQSFLLGAFHSVFETMFNLLKISPIKLQEFNITLKNHANMDHFKKIPVEKRIVVLPQCLRSIECPANLSAEDGIKCMGCGMCKIKDFVETAEKLKYKVFLVPGGTFVKRIIKRERPLGVIGIGCFPDLVEGMTIAKNAGISAQGILLDTSGCIETIVNWNKIYEKLYLGLNK